MKNKMLLLLLLLMANGLLFGQKMMTRSGEVNFEASMPALEEIAGKNNTASALFDKSNGEFVALVLIKAFRFKSPLMEEHFNENYLESGTFPKATFKGQVVGFDAAKLAAGKQVFEVSGDLTIHGVTQKVTTKMTFLQSSSKLIITGSFSVKPKDYKIDIPSLVKNKIAEDVKLALHFELENKL